MRSILLLLFCLAFQRQLYAEIGDPFDPTQSGSPEQINAEDANKSASELITEGEILLKDKRPLDARSKFLAALHKDPKQYHAHIDLSGYYMESVGHFRLSLKYIKRAEELFLEQQGPPPYTEFKQRYEHATILRLLSQARLNLDDYKGALNALDYFSSVGYHSDWYAGSRAWVLMKMGRLQDSIKVAQLGYLSLAGESERGNLLNMLGILYSMNDQRQAAIDIFKSATKEELSLGEYGYPATPLNNLGEVYKEIFSDDQAEATWQRAISFPDGCEHVLPSLNLTILLLDQLKLKAASETMNRFESCVAQFPLRNGEEHRALVGLARGRIAMLSGNPKKALQYFEDALMRQQWYGKIGTNEDDLRAAALVSMSQAELAYANQLSSKRRTTWREGLNLNSQSLSLRIKSWWHMRRARQVVSEELNDFEDLYPRNTDSLFQYYSLGDLVAGLPSKAVARKIEALRSKDTRKEAQLFYDIYKAQNLLENGSSSQARQLLSQALGGLRPGFDSGLRLQALLLQLRFFPIHSAEYQRISHTIIGLNKAALRNAGFRLPVNLGPGLAQIANQFDHSPFLLESSAQLQYQISYQFKTGEHVLSLLSFGGSIGNIRVKSSSLDEALDKLADEVFSEEL